MGHSNFEVNYLCIKKVFTYYCLLCLNLRVYAPPHLFFSRFRRLFLIVEIQSACVMNRSCVSIVTDTKSCENASTFQKTTSADKSVTITWKSFPLNRPPVLVHLPSDLRTKGKTRSFFFRSKLTHVARKGGRCE